MASHPHNFPKLHNAAWPGVVGKGPDSEPPIDLDTMLDLTAAAEVDGVKFDGCDLFLFAPHVEIDSSDDDLKQLADKARRRNLVYRHGRGAGLAADRRRLGHGHGRRAEGVFDAGPQRLPHRQAAARVGRAALRRRADRFGLQRLRLGQGRSERPTASGLPKPSAQACAIAEEPARSWPPREKSAGAACTVGGGWCSYWKWSIGRARSASRPTWPTRCCTCSATTPRRTPSCPQNFDWKDAAQLEAALKQMIAALRPWTIDFHVAQNDATVHGTGSHDKTGRHCLPNDPNAKLDMVKVAGLLAARRGGQPDQEAAGTSAGTAACFPTP